MRLMKILQVVVVSFLLVGCSSKSYFEGNPRAGYEPVPIDGAKKETAALVKAADGIGIWKVDGKREASFIKVMASGGYDSILLNEGYHTITCHRRGDLAIGRTFYKKGHEYLIDYLEERDGNRRRVYYWVKDLTEDEVVYGSEKKLSDFANE